MMTVIIYPNKKLYKKTEILENINNKIIFFLKNMNFQMYKLFGIGLSSIQININRNFFITDVNKSFRNTKIFINPNIFKFSFNIIEIEEGCLSIKNIYNFVIRSSEIKMFSFNKYGKKKKIQANGLLSICIQHEIDHLNGKIFIQYASNLKYFF